MCTRDVRGSVCTRCSVFTSGMCTRGVCKGVCVQEYVRVCKGVCEGVCVERECVQGVVCLQEACGEGV